MSTSAVFRPPHPHERAGSDYVPWSPERESLVSGRSLKPSDRDPARDLAADVQAADSRSRHAHAKKHSSPTSPGVAERCKGDRCPGKAWPTARWPWDEAALLSAAAELLAAPWRDTLTASTSASIRRRRTRRDRFRRELIDFFRFNVHSCPHLESSYLLAGGLEPVVTPSRASSSPSAVQRPRDRGNLTSSPALEAARRLCPPPTT